MIYDSSFDAAPRIRKFEYTAKYGTLTQKVTYDAQIPPLESTPIDEVVQHICVTNHLLPIFQKDVDTAFREFVDEETQRYENEIGDAAIKEILENGAAIQRLQAVPAAQLESSEAREFAERFQFIMRNSPHERLKMVIEWERRMEEEMSSLVYARDFELDRLMHECEQAMSASASANQKTLPESGQHLSRLNERIREVSGSYAQQIKELKSKQRAEFRNLIKGLYEHDVLPALELSSPVIDSPTQKTPLLSTKSDRNFSAGATLNESFTIYLGAQLKTMHNARLTTFNNLCDFCRPPPDSDEDSLNTRRLQMNLSIYGRHLSALVLLVGQHVRYHIEEKTDFAKLCERSTELHFDSLEEQLEDIADIATRDSLFEGGGIDKPLFPVGALYVTRHSNLSNVQAIFHLVVDDTLYEEEISSRHPCINGLRNAIRFAAKNGVTTFTIPLLLVNKSAEHMSVAWCLKRAELVFKCVKGFMMEACSGSSTAGGGPPTATTHYNVNFALPGGLDNSAYTQILDLFPTIFHLVPSVVM